MGIASAAHVLGNLQPLVNPVDHINYYLYVKVNLVLTVNLYNVIISPKDTRGRKHGYDS